LSQLKEPGLADGSDMIHLMPTFVITAPLEWNRLPHHIRALQSIDSFKVALKTYLFDCS